MAEQDLKQVMLDAILDADSLERFINGSDSETVLTRLSAKYPTLQKAIKQMFENGGLPATPFKTKVLMTASSLPNDSYAVVTDDVIADNNGLYIKEGGVWVKSKYDVTDKIQKLKKDSGDIAKGRLTLTSSYVHINSGLVSPGSGYATSEMLEVLGGYDYELYTPSSGNAANAWYNKNGEFISSFKAQNPTIVTAPKNASFLRVSVIDRVVDDAYVLSLNHPPIDRIVTAVEKYGRTSPEITKEGIKKVLNKDKASFIEQYLTVDELINSVKSKKAPHAYPVGRTAYVHSLRSNVVADGMTWRLPDGTSAIFDANEVYPYPDWFETKKALPNFAKKYHKIFSVDNTELLSTQAQPKYPIYKTNFYGSNRLALSSLNGYPTSITFAVNEGELHEYLYFDFKGDIDNFWRITLVFYDELGNIISGRGVHPNYTSITTTSGAPFSLAHDYVKQMMPLHDIPNIGLTRKIEIKLESHGGKLAEIFLSDIDSVTIKPAITLRFDDSMLSVYERAYPHLKANGLTGLVAAVTNKLSKPEHPTYMSNEQVIELRKNGWDIVSHTHNERTLPSMTNEEIRFECRESQKYLREVLGVGMVASSCLIAPNSLMDERTYTIAYEYFDCQINLAFVNPPVPDRSGGSYLSSGSWMRLGRIDGDKISDSQVLINKAEAVIAQKGWGIFMMHNIVEGIAGSYDTNEQALKEFCEWLAANKDRVDVVTVTDMVKRVRPNAN